MSAVGEITRHGKTPEVREARRLFLFGGADGARVLKVERLAELSGAHVQTIRRHLAAWEAEAESMLAQASESNLAMRLNGDLLAKHEADCMFLRSRIDAQVAEIQELPRLEKSLLSAVRKIADCGNPEAADSAVALLAKFFEAGNYRRTAEAHLVKLQGAWARSSGVESLQAVAETREKALATGRAKLALRAEAAEAVPGGDGARLVGGSAGPVGGVFAKRSPVPVVESEV